MPLPTSVKGDTEAHAEPAQPEARQVQPALLCVFPEQRAMVVPKSMAPVGREWLAEHGILDKEVSGVHLQFLHTRMLQIQDVGSSNGTWLNGVPLTARRKVTLEDGAILRLGRTLLVYREAFTGPLEPTPPIGGTLVGPFGTQSVSLTIEALRRNPPANVLIEGETGTGKELAAAAIAETLGRSQPYAAVNVAGVSAGVFESQLFGHVPGAFSGAQTGSQGIVPAHDGGAVFLDEIGELPLELQVKLLRLVENREVLPVGADRPTVVDVLLLAATNRPLEQMVEEGKFRQDLLARLNIARVELPPLRERPEDVWAIAQAIAPQAGCVIETGQVEVEAVERLLLDPWPNNVRGLIAALSRIAAIDTKPGLRMWAVDQVLPPMTSSRAATLTDERVTVALKACGGNETRAARWLGVTRGKLRRFLKKQAG